MSVSSASLTVLHQSDDCRAAWKHGYDALSDASPFLHHAFQDGLERVVPWSRVVIRSSEQAVLSGFIRSRGPVKDLVLAPFQPFSAIGAGLDVAELTERLRASSEVPRNWLLSITPDQYAALDPNAIAGTVRVMERHTFHLPTAPLEEAIAAWSSAPRRQFRKSIADYAFWSSHAGAGDGSPEAQKLDQVIHGAVTLTVEAYQRHGRPLPLPARGLARWARDLVYAGIARVYGLFGTDSGEVEAAIVALHGDGKAWYWLAGSKPGPAMTVLMAHVQHDLHQAGIPVLDLMGANTPGISEFKRRFGGERVTYAHLVSRTLAGSVTNSLAHLLARFAPRKRPHRSASERSEVG